MLPLSNTKESFMNCLFCQIVKNEISAKIIYRDDWVVVFDDINPQAPQHKLIIPQKHISTLNELVPEDNELVGYMVQTAKMLAKELNIADEGYRLIMNCNAGAGQTVFHVHAHLLGGRKFTWPPG
jgi:histidine triad (HIT) family protein